MKITFKKKTSIRKYNNEPATISVYLEEKKIGEIKENKRDGKYYISFALRNKATKGSKEHLKINWVFIDKPFDSEKQAMDEIKKLESNLLKLDFYRFNIDF